MAIVVLWIKKNTVTQSAEYGKTEVNVSTERGLFTRVVIRSTHRDHENEGIFLKYPGT